MTPPPRLFQAKSPPPGLQGDIGRLGASGAPKAVRGSHVASWPRPSPPIASTPIPGRFVGGTRSTIAGRTLPRTQLDYLADAGQHIEIAHFLKALASDLRERRISEHIPDSLFSARECNLPRV